MEKIHAGEPREESGFVIAWKDDTQEELSLWNGKCAAGTDERSTGELQQFKQVPQEGAKPPMGSPTKEPAALMKQYI